MIHFSSNRETFIWTYIIRELQSKEEGTYGYEVLVDSSDDFFRKNMIFYRPRLDWRF